MVFRIYFHHELDTDEEFSREQCPYNTFNLNSWPFRYCTASNNSEMYGNVSKKGSERAQVRFFVVYIGIHLGLRSDLNSVPVRWCRWSLIHIPLITVAKKNINSSSLFQLFNSISKDCILKRREIVVYGCYCYYYKINMNSFIILQYNVQW